MGSAILLRSLPAAGAALFGACALAAGAFSAGGAELRVPSPALPMVGAALARARDGDTIRIAPGLYRERLAVAKRVSLIGEAGAEGRAVIDGGGEGRVIELRVPGVEVKGLTVRGSGDDLDHPDACLYVGGAARGARVQGNLLEDCAFGVWVNGAAGVEIVANLISARPKRLVSEIGNGIYLWQIRNGLIRGNAIERVRDGIFVAAATDSRVEDNRMRDLRFGIHYMYSDRNEVAGNVACGSRIGMAIMESRHLLIRDNIALGNEEHGILLRTIYDSTVTGNASEGNGTGLVVNDSAYNRIEGNRVSGNALGVHVTGGNEEIVVVGNAFLGNRAQVRFGMRQPVHWDDGARGNYWSDHLSWDLDRDGWGDRPYQASNAIDRLVFRYPELRLLAASPVLLLMQWVEARFPVARAPSVIDRHPAMRRPPEGPGLAERARAFLEAAAGTPAAAGAEFCARAPAADSPARPEEGR